MDDVKERVITVLREKLKIINPDIDESDDLAELRYLEESGKTNKDGEPILVSKELEDPEKFSVLAWGLEHEFGFDDGCLEEDIIAAGTVHDVVMIVEEHLEEGCEDE
jgi:hypothetical protein